MEKLIKMRKKDFSGYFRSIYVLTLILFLSVENSYSQTFTRHNDWKKHRKTFFCSVGTSNYLGDLGGRDQKGTDFSPADLDFQVMQMAYGLGYSYKLLRWFNAAAKLSYLKVEGNDALTKDIYRNNRNLNFKSNIFELTGRIEMGWKSNKIGNRYHIKRTRRSRMKDFNQELFLFAGIGGFYFNPWGKARDGSYVELRKLHTEGQGLPGGSKKYSRFSVCVPFGVYYKITINKQITFGLELSWRTTFTDYIDDVGGTYYDNKELALAYGDVSAQMADRNLGKIPGATAPDGSGAPAQRGDREKDSYLSLEVTFGYVVKHKYVRMLRSKF
jgi:hypothetical protein